MRQDCRAAAWPHDAAPNTLAPIAHQNCIQNSACRYHAAHGQPTTQPHRCAPDPRHGRAPPATGHPSWPSKSRPTTLACRARWCARPCFSCRKTAWCGRSPRGRFVAAPSADEGAPGVCRAPHARGRNRARLHAPGHPRQTARAARRSGPAKSRPSSPGRRARAHRAAGRLHVRMAELMGNQVLAQMLARS